MSAAQKRTPVPWTEEEYLDREENSAERHEFIDGLIYLMAGSTPEHSALSANAIVSLGMLARQSGCQVHTSDLRIRTRTGRFYYPDASVVCGRPELMPPQKPRRTATLLNPRIIVEVLSSSTEEEDRGEKFRHYRTIPSLTDYVLVAQDQVLIEHHARQPSGGWLLRELGPGEVLHLLGGEVPVEDLYGQVLNQ